VHDDDTPRRPVKLAETGPLLNFQNIARERREIARRNLPRAGLLNGRGRPVNWTPQPSAAARTDAACGLPLVSSSSTNSPIRRATSQTATSPALTPRCWSSTPMASTSSERSRVTSSRNPDCRSARSTDCAVMIGFVRNRKRSKTRPAAAWERPSAAQGRKMSSQDVAVVLFLRMAVSKEPRREGNGAPAARGPGWGPGSKTRHPGTGFKFQTVPTFCCRSVRRDSIRVISSRSACG